jgi:hypothetical protein
MNTDGHDLGREMGKQDQGDRIDEEFGDEARKVLRLLK